MHEYDYRKMLKSLNKKTVSDYITVLKSNPPDTTRKLTMALRIPKKKVRESPEFKEIISYSTIDCVDNVLKSNYGPYRHTKEIPRMLEKVVKTGFLTDEIKKNIASRLGDILPEFYPYAKKALLSVALQWVETEEDALNIIQRNFKSLESSTLDTLVSKVQNGYDNDKIKSLTEKGMAFKANKFNSADINDPDIRKQFINTIAETPSILTKIKHDIHITLDDFRLLPPARRFKFMQQVFNPIMSNFDSTYQGYYYNSYGNRVEYSPKDIAIKILSRYTTKTNDAWMNKVSVDSISYDDLYELLFAVAINKNKEVVRWLERYKKFNDQRPKVKKVFENVLKWL
jgi:hypothetical protein